MNICDSNMESSKSKSPSGLALQESSATRGSVLLPLLLVWTMLLGLQPAHFGGFLRVFLGLLIVGVNTLLAAPNAGAGAVYVCGTQCASGGG
jgi:hypothetical protein